MPDKPTYEELEKRIEVLEKEALRRALAPRGDEGRSRLR